MVEVVYCNNYEKRVISLPLGTAQVKRVYEIMGTSDLQVVYLDQDICAYARRVPPYPGSLRTYEYIRDDFMAVTTYLPDPVLITRVDSAGYIRPMTWNEKEEILKHLIIRNY